MPTESSLSRLDGRRSGLELPLATAHGAVRGGGLAIDPLENAVEVIRMVAHSPYQRAVVPWELAVRAAPVKGHTAYATCLVLCIPRPRPHCVPL